MSTLTIVDLTIWIKQENGPDMITYPGRSDRSSGLRVGRAVQLLQLLGDVVVQGGVVALRELAQPVDLVDQRGPLGADRAHRLGVVAPRVALDRRRAQLRLAGDLLGFGP